MGIYKYNCNYDNHVIFIGISRRLYDCRLFKPNNISCYETPFPNDDQILRNVHQGVKERIC